MPIFFFKLNNKKRSFLFKVEKNKALITKG